MYNNGSEHNPPHFHARYGDYRAVFNLEGDLTTGDFPAKQKHLIKAWALIHEDELLNLCMEQQQLYPIQPLK